MALGVRKGIFPEIHLLTRCWQVEGVVSLEGWAEPQVVEWQQHLCMCARWVFWKSVVLYKHHDVFTSIKTYFTVESSIVVQYRYFV